MVATLETSGHPPQGSQASLVTGGRTSGIVGMLGPEILVDVPAASCERWAQGFDTRAGTSAGQPTRELAGRVTVFVSGNPAVFFNTAGTPEQVSQELCMVSACMAWLDFDCAVSEVVASIALLFLLPLLFFSPRLSFLCSLYAAPRFGRIFHFGIFGPIIRGRLDVDYLDHGPLRGSAAALS